MKNLFTLPLYFLIVTSALIMGCHSDKVNHQTEIGEIVNDSIHEDGSHPPVSSKADTSSIAETLPVAAKSGAKMADLTGINAFEWDLLQNPKDPADGSRIYEPKMALAKSFGGVRHYIDWERLEHKPGQYTFNPTNGGGWYFDVMYERFKKEGIPVLSCFQNAPPWLSATYPAKERTFSNIPAPYGSDTEKPTSYLAQAKLGFQFAARYGANKNIDSGLVKVYKEPRWSTDLVNTVKIGLNYVRYVECGNEPDKWWLGKNSQQNGRQYAANLSAFYDGHKGTMGKNVGVKTADPSMKVVMGGIARPDIKFVREMIEWCKENRGYRPDGSVNLCFDVINFHMYSNDYTGWFAKFKSKKRGVAPETNDMGEIADGFVKLARELGHGMEVWTTETGYDLHPKSVQKVIAIGSKSLELTQADWILRTSLMYARHGLDRVFFYQMFDDKDAKLNAGETFGASGLVTLAKRRSAADYLLQVRKLMGEYRYSRTINEDPVVDVYQMGKKSMYILVVPDEKDRKEAYELNMNGAKTATIYYLKPGSDQMEVRQKKTQNGKLKILVSETPVFVQGS
ncbi:hypothetical protein [Pedobacter caeni]|uniref:Glycosyl hydrolase catalytic core n=1 Tax=Pedobacter caeni TaxID=288992 RepID=A0A1M4WT34_9SPHI|nr:hypothetical protein [Pedobacter caeni]SHE84360.1 hypothetical protein SAMN04488522_1011374 [Pedobacter caeni]